MVIDERVIEIVRRSEIIAVVGCSATPYRDSNSSARYLMEQGYRVLPINPKYDAVLDLKAYADLPSAQEAEGPIDIVAIFRAPQFVRPHVEEAVEIGTRLVWMQLGVINAEAAQLARDAGIPVVMDECLRVKHKEWKRQGIL
jgi:predicted CoA-binding protein